MFLGVRGYTFLKNLPIFSGLYTPLPGVRRYIIRATGTLEPLIRNDFYFKFTVSNRDLKYFNF